MNQYFWNILQWNNVSEIFCNETIFLKYFAMKQYFWNILQVNMKHKDFPGKIHTMNRFPSGLTIKNELSLGFETKWIKINFDYTFYKKAITPPPYALNENSLKNLVIELIISLTKINIWLNISTAVYCSRKLRCNKLPRTEM